MLNDQIIAYLKAKSISWVAADFMTGIPEGGADQILHWDTTKLGPQPSQADLDAAEAAAKAAATSAANKAEAARLLQQTDWVEIPSVTDPASSPHLLNKDEFMVYRAALRAIAVNAPSAPVEFPQAPAETWSS